MEGVRSEHFPAEKPDTRYESCLICPKCYARTCVYKRTQSLTSKNYGRWYFKCPAPETEHNLFFKWADEVKPHELIQVPYCGGCSAGVCRLKRETSGPNAGRIMFMCTIKEGDGSCGYKVWKDELEMSEAAQAEERMNLFQSANVTVTDMDEESRQRDEGTDIVSPFLEPSDDVIYRELITSQTMDHEVISRKMDQSKYPEEKSNTTLRTRRPHKRSRYGYIVASGFPISDSVLTVRLPLNSTTRHRWMADAIRQNLSTELNGWWGRLVFHPRHSLMTSALKPSTSSVSYPLESTFVVRDVLVHRSGSIAATKNSKGVKSYRKLSFNLELHHSPIDSTYMVQEKIMENSNDMTTSNELSDKPATHSIMSRSISNVFHQAVERLQNELIARLETLDVKDHEAMSEAAEATFAALDCFRCDYKDFKKRAKELIHCARQLVEIDRAMPTNASYQKLVEICSSEREELDKINCVHAAAVEAVINKKNRIEALQEEISKIEVEVSCCEVEVRNWELRLEKICKEKEVLEGKYLIASKEVESQKLLDQKEAEQNAAFRRARALLRG